MNRPIRLLIASMLLAACHTVPAMQDTTPTPPRMRVATFNIALYGERSGEVLARTRGGEDARLRQIAAVIQQVRPDVLLLNEVDHDASGALAAVLKHAYLEVPQFGQAPIHYAHHWSGPVNTGEPSGVDINGDGMVGGPGRLAGEDAFGYGLYPGQYGLLVLSRFPIRDDAIRTFRELKWSSMPGARRPHHPDGRPFHADAVWSQLRLSSKTHADLPLETPLGVVHFLVSHPTPPAFDGPEKRNMHRNADELRLWQAYLDAASEAWLRDDQGQPGGLPDDVHFVIAGDLNNDPVDGDGDHTAIENLLRHPRVRDGTAPRGMGGVQSALQRGGANEAHRGDPATDTAEFGNRVGNLRLDYVLPSRSFRVVDSGVFWPVEPTPGHDWVAASDHRLVWVDLTLESTP